MSSPGRLYQMTRAGSRLRRHLVSVEYFPIRRRKVILLIGVFAVKTNKLDVKTDTSAAVVGFNLHFNTLARAEIMGLFKR